MSVEGELTDGKQLYLRNQLGNGTIEGLKFDLSISIDNKAIFIEFEKGWVIYHTKDMIEDAYRKIREVEK